MITSYGPCYADSHKGYRKVKKTYSAKKTKRGLWCVFEVHSGEVFLTDIPTKPRAYYAAARMNGVDVSFFFNFGSAMFQK